MSFFIPLTTTQKNALCDPQNLRFFKIEIGGTDYSDMLLGNPVSGGQTDSYASWSVTLTDTIGTFDSGALGGEDAHISYQIGDTGFFRIFTGKVSEEGAVVTRGMVGQNTVKLKFVDFTALKGTTRKPDNSLFIGFKVSDTGTVTTSLLHRLGGLMGVSTIDTVDIDFEIPIVEFGKKNIWQELTALKALYLAEMYFRWDGALRFYSPFEVGYSTPVSEWTFIADGSAIAGPGESLVHGVVQKSKKKIAVNRCTVEFDKYEQLSTQIVYKNTTNYDSVTQQISIEIEPGEYWPGDGASDVAALEYKDPVTGEAYDYASDIITPTIGAVGAEQILNIPEVP